MEGTKVGALLEEGPTLEEVIAKGKRGKEIHGFLEGLRKYLIADSMRHISLPIKVVELKIGFVRIGSMVSSVIGRRGYSSVSNLELRMIKERFSV